jgi:hypothetical protein
MVPNHHACAAYVDHDEYVTASATPTEYLLRQV